MLEDYVIQTRRALHRHPEVGFDVLKTHDFIADELEKYPVSIHRHVGQNSLVAVLENQNGPVIGLRADIDALPLLEQNHTIPYRSENIGSMHACGHDAHTAMLLGTIAFLSENKDLWHGTVKFIFQEAEEGPHPGGAYGVVKSGLLADVDCFYALHVSPDYPSGTIAIKAGTMFAAVNTFKITLKGKGGHAAYPHRCIDPAIMASEAILGFQTIVSRRLPPWEKAVLSVTKVISGTTHNIIPDSAYLEGTIRTFSREIRNQIKQEMETIMTGIAKAHSGEFQFEFIDEYDPVINSIDAVQNFENVVTKVLGTDHFLTLDNPSMGGEDFFRYIDLKQGGIAWLGTAIDDSTRYSLHHPCFNLDETALIDGVLVLINLVINT